MSEKKKRRRWTAGEKLRVVLAGWTARWKSASCAAGKGSIRRSTTAGRSSCCRRRRRCSPTAGSRSRRRNEQRLETELASGEGRGCGDHGGEPRPKKRALGLEDHGQLPPELQRQVHAVVQRRSVAAAGRCGGPCGSWACRRRATTGGGRKRGRAKTSAEPPRPVQAYEATDEEKRAVRSLRLKTSGNSPSGAGLADGRRGGRLPESVDGVPDFEGGESGLSLDETNEADPGGGGESAACGRDLGDGPDVRA